MNSLRPRPFIMATTWKLFVCIIHSGLVQGPSHCVNHWLEACIKPPISGIPPPLIQRKMIQRLKHRDTRILDISTIININHFRMQRIHIDFLPGRTFLESVLIFLQYIVTCFSARLADSVNSTIVGTVGCRRSCCGRSTCSTSYTSSFDIIIRSTRHQIRHHRRNRPRLKTRTQTSRPAKHLGIPQHQLQTSLSSQTTPHDAHIFRTPPRSKFILDKRM
mmetsp:Transcript_2242/g.3549  ORF Transcript_2242/g.3549 Transcript_2242/m.3549 type:complete len:219 (-) Transcript_2242:21-677(-)